MLSIYPQARQVIVHRWNEELEKRARRCRGCGEWNFAVYCEWCADMCDTTTYRIQWAEPGWDVHHDGLLVHHAPSLLEAENWVTRGGAARIPTNCRTRVLQWVASDTPADAGGRGTVGAAPDLADDPKEVIDNAR